MTDHQKCDTPIDALLQCGQRTMCRATAVYTTASRYTYVDTVYCLLVLSVGRSMKAEMGLCVCVCVRARVARLHFIVRSKLHALGCV